MSNDQGISLKIVGMTTRGNHSFPTFWRLQVWGWAAFYALTVLDALPYLYVAPSKGWPRIIEITCIYGVLFAASCVLRPICRSLLKRTRSWLQLQLYALLWASLLGASVAALVQIIALHFPEPDWVDLITNYLRYSMLLVFWCNLYFGIKQWQRSNQEREHLAQEREHRTRVEADARDARLSALRYQLNPHFLFNSLNAVSTLAIEGDIPAVTRMLAQIADLLRITLDGERPFEVSLSEEMTFTERYLAIEQTQLGERLQVDLSIAAETLGAAVPSMVLQPLVENAVRHGIAPVVEGGKLTIRSVLNDRTLQIFINNTGPRGVQPYRMTGGIGLTNTVERLQTLYGPYHNFDLQWPEAGGCSVLIEIPFHRASQRLEELACAY